MLLGIEIGGTKLQLGLGNGDGKLAGLWRGRIEPSRGPEGIRQQIVAAVPELLHQAKLASGDLAAVTIGFGGPVDDAFQTVIKSHQIEGWDSFPLARWIGDFLHLPALLANDSDAAGLAEAVCGAGKGLSPIYYMNIGSGIGGGFVLDGRIYRGTGRGAAETGHLRIARWTKDGLVYETLEDLASGWAIERRARAAIQKHPECGREWQDLNADPSTLTVAQIGAAVRAGNSLAREILEPSWDCAGGSPLSRCRIALSAAHRNWRGCRVTGRRRLVRSAPRAREKPRVRRHLPTVSISFQQPLAKRW